MLTIPIQPVPSQQVQCVLAGQNCQIAIYSKTTGIFVDLNSNGSDVSVAVLGLNTVKLTHNYSGFSGNLLFVDTQGSDDPTDYTTLGSRHQLVYVTATEQTSLVRKTPNTAEGMMAISSLLTDNVGNLIETNTGDVIIVTEG